MAVALDAGAVAERLRDRLADDIAGVLGRVVEIDVQIALRLQRDVDQAVLRELLEHVVEKPDAGRDLGRAGAVEIDPALDPRLPAYCARPSRPAHRSPAAAPQPRRHAIAAPF